MNKPINLEEQIKNKLREQKNTEYGNYEINFNLLAMLWSVILKNSLHTDIKPHQVAQCMVMLKMLRTTEKFKSDSYLDASIYLDMANKCELGYLDKLARKFRDRAEMCICLKPKIAKSINTLPHIHAPPRGDKRTRPHQTRLDQTTSD